MGKNRQHAKRPGAVGPDGLSRYARKCRDREIAPPVPPMKSSQMPDSTLVVPARTPVTSQPKAVTVIAMFIGAGKPAVTSSGEYLYLPFGVLKKQGYHIRMRSLIECKVVPAELGKKLRQVIALKPVE